MTTAIWYDLWIEEPLAAGWSAWFGGLTIAAGPDGWTCLSGPLGDQAALHGVLNRIRDLNLTLVSLRRRTLAADDRTLEIHHAN